MTEQKVVPFELRQYRTYLGDMDEVYMNMATCRDRTVLAVNKWRLTRTEQFLAALHDISVRVLKTEDGFGVMAPIDLASHGLYDFRTIQGTFEAKYRMMHLCLENKTEVYVQTIHPRLSFSAYYVPNLKLSEYPRYSHILCILGKDNGRYVYLDNTAPQSRFYLPYEKNEELGVCDVEEIDRNLREIFSLSLVNWNEEKRAYLGEYPYRIMQDYCQEIDNGIVDGATGRTLLTGMTAIDCMHDFFAGSNNNSLKEKSQYVFLDRGEILCWRMDDLVKRRVLLSISIKKGMIEIGNKNKEITDSLEDSARAWNALKTHLLYEMKHDGDFIPDYSKEFARIFESERKLKRAMEVVFG